MYSLFFQTVGPNSTDEYLGLISSLEDNFIEFRRLKNELTKVFRHLAGSLYSIPCHADSARNPGTGDTG